MRTAALAPLALLGLLVLSSFPAPAPPASFEAQELSHGAIAPFMHIAALDIPRGIRPGAWVQIGGSDCTSSFVVKDSSNRLYLTTAAHCTQAVGQRARITEGGMVGQLTPPYEFGTVVAAWNGGLDAALIRIDADKYANVNPSMPGWGGPTGLLTSTPTTDVGIRHYGWQWATWYEHYTRCRMGVAKAQPLPFAPGWTSSTFWYNGVGGSGDSGSAIMTDSGLAVGILDWGTGPPYGVPVPGGPLEGTLMGGVRFDRVLATWNAQLGLGLTLVTGSPVNPVCMPEPPLP